jgi:hypothetical protein
MRFFFGVIVGALCMAVYAYRKQISDVWNNRKALSAGGRAVDGVTQTVDAVKDFLREINGAGNDTGATPPSGGN